MTAPTKILVTPGEAADMLSVSTDVIYRAAAAGLLEKRFIGKGSRVWRIPVDSLRAYVDQLPTEPKDD